MTDNQRAAILRRAIDEDIGAIQNRAVTDGGDTAEQIMESAFRGLYRSKDGDL